MIKLSRGDWMLSRFSVENYKCFEKKIIFDLTKVRDYSFNNFVIKNNIINKALIYGKNASGKTSLGYAMFDIVDHLSDKKSNKRTAGYVNANSKKSYSSFSYGFIFDNVRITYKYKKNENRQLREEKLLIDDKLVFHYDFEVKVIVKNLIEETKQLRWKTKEDNVSAIRFMISTIDLGDDNIVNKMFHFVNKMLWFKSLEDVNDYIGYSSISGNIDQYIFDKKLCNQLQEFLWKNDITEKLKIEMQGGKPIINFAFDKYNIPFKWIASSGTKSLLLIFYWMKFAFEDASLVFIDEFDAFYHHELSASIIDLLFSDNRFQVFVTSHNSSLISNEKYRPDVYFQIGHSMIKSFSDMTRRGIREAHSLEKMYKVGEFDF